MTKKVGLIIKVSSCFVFTVIIAGVITYGSLSYKHKKLIESTNGVGGLEIPSVPQYAEDAAKMVLSENSDSVLTSEDVANQDSSTEKVLSDDDLFYIPYRIKKGDMIGVIADKYGISQDTLISVNKIRSTRTIQIGQNIKIPSLNGILYSVKKDGETPDSIAKKYEVSSAEILKVNHLSEDASLNAGQSIFVPGAELDWITRQEINGDLFRKPIHSYYRISSYYGWRASPFSGSRQFHGGIDMACPYGTKIYAAMEGRIAYKGYSNVYGNYVIIQHHSGYRTLYGHMSSFSNLGVGAYVTQASVIGYVGSTGQSTGPHCHFTVFKNGRMVNPYNLWG